MSKRIAPKLSESVVRKVFQLWVIETYGEDAHVTVEDFDIWLIDIKQKAWSEGSKAAGELGMKIHSSEYEMIWKRYATDRVGEMAISEHLDLLAMDARKSLALAEENEAIAWGNYRLALGKEDDE